MNDKLKQLEIQKLLQEYNYLLLDDEYKQELIAEGKTPFLEHVHEFMATLNMSPPPPMPPVSGKEGKSKKRIDPNTVDEHVRVKVKKLYRDIVKLTHPDRAETDEHNDLYVDATIAMETYDLFELYNICVKLNIAHTIDAMDKPIIEMRVQAKKDELANIERSYVWLWYHAATDADKLLYVRNFVENHGGSFI